jgi:phage head maturation protease
VEHLMLKAATTATDEGTFEAVISTSSVDREKDVVSPAGMVRALQKWAATGKKIPLAWNHSGAADQQVGWVDPESVKQVGSEVVASGYIDQSTATGEHVWRLAKSGTLGFSFGYLILKGSGRKGGGRNIDELDVFEITATTTPMNNDTRVLGWKADVPMVQLLNAMLGMANKFIDQEDDPDDIAAMRQIADRLKTLGAAEATEPDDSTEDMGKALRKRADAIALEHAAGETTSTKTAPAPDLPEGAGWLFPETELDAARAGEIKAAWTTAFITALPDSSFLHVTDTGNRFPVKDDAGQVDVPHLRSALKRIPRSDLPQNVKDELTAKAQRILDEKSVPVDVADKEPERARSVDPLRQQADAIELEHASDGESLRKSPRPIKAAPPVFKYSVQELRRRAREEMLTALSGIEETE